MSHNLKVSQFFLFSSAALFIFSSSLHAGKGENEEKNISVRHALPQSQSKKSKPPHPHEPDEKYVKTFFLTKREGDGSTFDMAESVKDMDTLQIVFFFAKNVVSPWVLSSPDERVFFLEFIENAARAHSYGKAFLDNLLVLKSQVQQDGLMAPRTIIACLKSLKHEDKTHYSIVREALVNVLSSNFESCKPSNDLKKRFYDSIPASLFAEYRSTIIKTTEELGKAGIRPIEKLSNNMHYRKAAIKLEELRKRLPQKGIDNLLHYLALTKLSLNTREGVEEALDLYEQARQLHEERKEKCKVLHAVDEFEKYRDQLWKEQAIWLFKLAEMEKSQEVLDEESKKNLEKEREKHLKKAALLMELLLKRQETQVKNPETDAEDDEMKKEDIHYFLANVHRELKNDEAEKKFFQEWQKSHFERMGEKKRAAEEKRKKHAMAIKNAIAIQREEERQKSLQENKESSPPLLSIPQSEELKEPLPEEKKELASSPESLALDLTSFSLQSSFKKEKEAASQKKEKVKTRGTPDPSRAEEVIENHEQMNPSSQKITVEQLLRKGSKSYRLFCKFFSDQEEEISMHKTQKLLEKLYTAVDDFITNQEEMNSNNKSALSRRTLKEKAINSSQGKGSHTKAIARNSEKKVVFTLAKHSQLLRYQKEELRDGFIKLGYYPEDYYSEDLEKAVR